MHKRSTFSTLELSLWRRIGHFCAHAQYFHTVCGLGVELHVAIMYTGASLVPSLYGERPSDDTASGGARPRQKSWFRPRSVDVLGLWRLSMLGVEPPKFRSWAVLGHLPWQFTVDLTFHPCILRVKVLIEVQHTR